MHLTSPLFGAAMLATLILATPAPGVRLFNYGLSGYSTSCWWVNEQDQKGHPNAAGCALVRRLASSERTLSNNSVRSLALIAQPGTLTTMGNDKDGPDGFPKRAGTQDWKFPYDDSWGEGVLVYVVDSGVRKTHVELAGRVEDGWVLPRIGGSTGVAALIAGNTLGIARKATIVPVKISDDKGCTKIPSTTEDVTAGVNWAVSDYNSFSRRSAKGGIINISWETYQTDASQKAFEDAIAAGMHIVVSAGNFDQNQVIVFSHFPRPLFGKKSVFDDFDFAWDGKLIGLMPKISQYRVLRFSSNLL
ncbi:peptidase S8/S53 domain-containing protein [Mycena rebaudengoi]|nr:peptidase S8/S53 domain-containing protein [Mycena rebaudengoi]